MPVLSTIRDKFDDIAINTAIWSPGTIGAGSTIIESGGKLICTPVASIVNAEAYCPYLSFTPAFDFTGSFAVAQVKQVLNAVSGVETSLHVIHDDSNYFKIAVDGTPNLAAQYNSTGAGFITLNAIAYNATAMLWWRIREWQGITYFDYSSDGITWINFASVANPFVITTVYPKIRGYANNVVSPGAAWFANFNIPPMNQLKNASLRPRPFAPGLAR